MIITEYGIIVFQLVIWIGVIAEKSVKSVLWRCIYMLGFPYNAIPTRHEVPQKPYLHGNYFMIGTNPQN